MFLSENVGLYKSLLIFFTLSVFLNGFYDCIVILSIEMPIFSALKACNPLTITDRCPYNRVLRIGVIWNGIFFALFLKHIETIPVNLQLMISDDVIYHVHPAHESV